MLGSLKYKIPLKSSTTRFRKADWPLQRVKRECFKTSQAHQQQEVPQQEAQLQVVLQQVGPQLVAQPQEGLQQEGHNQAARQLAKPRISGIQTAGRAQHRVESIVELLELRELQR